MIARMKGENIVQVKEYGGKKYYNEWITFRRNKKEKEIKEIVKRNKKLKISEKEKSK